MRAMVAIPGNVETAIFLLLFHALSAWFFADPPYSIIASRSVSS